MKIIPLFTFGGIYLIRVGGVVLLMFTFSLGVPMRKITETATKNFYSFTPFKSGATSVVIDESNGIKTAYLVLHGSKIAYHNSNETAIRTCGYNTNVTKERLRGVLGRCGYNLYQKSGELFLESTTDYEHTLEFADNHEWFVVTSN